MQPFWCNHSKSPQVTLENQLWQRSHGFVCLSIWKIPVTINVALLCRRHNGIPELLSLEVLMCLSVVLHKSKMFAILRAGVRITCLLESVEQNCFVQNCGYILRNEMSHVWLKKKIQLSSVYWGEMHTCCSFPTLVLLMLSYQQHWGVSKDWSSLARYRAEGEESNQTHWDQSLGLHLWRSISGWLNKTPIPSLATET